MTWDKQVNEESMEIGFADQCGLSTLISIPLCLINFILTQF